MFQTDIALSPEMTVTERQQAIRDAYNQDRSQMTLMLAHQLRIAEVDILRALEGDTARELDFNRWEEIIRAFEALGDVTVIVSNGSTTIESFGQFGGFSNAQGFLNVRSKSLDMHIRGWELASVFAFRKPSHLDKHESLSFQFFDKRGNSAFKVFLNFGGKDPAPELVEKYNELIKQFAMS
ncbi:MAG TPA: ChuX/HutX family heme-like substrate-binding protein [Anaerolineales bacterium]|nr:ChuX/HutX family heme-like substrate-binding protein [Anaerolineales bacterium]HNA89269.1 ChuX/HutX family heme-like substrate-binding protein [Anaerolineales bacterium]HNB36060.1 ChuX/HutX family heme-like substrate-binding protein [Anaerolineales bacterium]HND50044.1 ChuX/HutX family heme-like substrate-binding protein [Anaerolineales bacterium]